MASTSGMQCSLTEDELVEVLENLPSDLSELSDSDNYLPENSDSDSNIDENNRVDPLEPAAKNCVVMLHYNVVEILRQMSTNSIGIIRVSGST